MHSSSTSSSEIDVSQFQRPTLKKVPTYIPGFDEVLHGGLPLGRSSLIIGGPGTGKTVFGLEFLYNNALHGKSGIFVSFEESVDAIRANSSFMSWDLARQERNGKLLLFTPRLEKDIIISGEFNISGLLSILSGTRKQMGASVIVLDAIDILLRIMDNPRLERDELFTLHDWLLKQDLTAVLTLKASEQMLGEQYSFLEYLTDCVVRLDQRVLDQVTTRRLRIVKYRGSAYGTNEYPYVIDNEGVTFVPISSLSLEHQRLGPFISSGIPIFDQLLGGGFRTASVTLVSGEAGAGKTSFVCSFAKAAAERGERILYITFEESEEALVSSMLSPGIDLRPALKSQNLRIMPIMPEAMGSELHLIMIMRELERFHPSCIILDAVSALVRMGNNTSFDFLIRMTNLCRNKGITTIMTNQLEDAQQTLTGFGFSSLLDTIVILDYVRGTGEVNRVLHVVKSRGAHHSNEFREYQITDHGIEIKETFIGDGKMLTGVDRQIHDAQERFDQLTRDINIDRMRREVTQLKLTKEAEIAAIQNEIKDAELQLNTLTRQSSLSKESHHLHEKETRTQEEQ